MATTTTLPPNLSTLPLEIQQSVLSHLHIPTLLTFASTSRHNYHLTTSVLTTLHLAVFSKRVHGVLAYLNYADTITITHPTTLNYLNDQPQLNWLNLPIRLPDPEPTAASTPHQHHHSHRLRRRPSSRPSQPTSTPPTTRTSTSTTTTTITPQAHRERQIHHQNSHLSSILSTSLLSTLTTLTIHTYALLSPSLAATLSSLGSLQHLTLNFCHPAIHDPCLPAFYWENAPSFEKEGCTAWNLLAGIGRGNGGDRGLRLRGLRTLVVRRAAITARQVWEWVGRNKGLEGLRLELVTGVDAECVEGMVGLWLREGEEEGERRGMLRKLELVNCPNLLLRERQDFAWVEVLIRKAGLRWLDLRGCAGVDGEVLKSVFEERNWGELGLVLAEDESERLETRSLDQEMDATRSVGGGKGSVIEIDPDFD